MPDIAITTIWKKSNLTSMWKMEPERGSKACMVVGKLLRELTEP